MLLFWSTDLNLLHQRAALETPRCAALWLCYDEGAFAFGKKAVFMRNIYRQFKGFTNPEKQNCVFTRYERKGV